jgi:5-methylcytosine-specific restriction endonuclease McrA
MDTTLPPLFYCPRCKGTYPREGFYWTQRTRYKRAIGPDGPAKVPFRVEARQAYCTSCHKNAQNASYRDPARKEMKRVKRVKERMRALKEGRRLTKTPVDTARSAERVKAWRARNRTKYQALDTLYKRMKRSPEFKRCWPLILKHYSGACCGCGDSQAFVDHVIPLDPSKPHTNSPANLQPLCRSCNGRKQGLAYDFRPDSGRWIVLNILNASAPFGPI